ncbi:hypothetical protein, conserved [Eimeria maxima]|uniref:Uncharacterized protein n=1 Tax=Eimeria maxima TaxID=5804 RepID=U6M5P3_EIMMA|nr:hypothetical protein, conserved [Eimeria maxima]CDJ59351.1 hypothetical protein, conserved [Eimeria maxima]
MHQPRIACTHACIGLRRLLLSNAPCRFSCCRTLSTQEGSQRAFFDVQTEEQQQQQREHEAIGLELQQTQDREGEVSNGAPRTRCAAIDDGATAGLDAAAAAAALAAAAAAAQGDDWIYEAKPGGPLHFAEHRRLLALADAAAAARDPAAAAGSSSSTINVNMDQHRNVSFPMVRYASAAQRRRQKECNRGQLLQQQCMQAAVTFGTAAERARVYRHLNNKEDKILFRRAELKAYLFFLSSHLPSVELRDLLKGFLEVYVHHMDEQQMIELLQLLQAPQHRPSQRQQQQQQQQQQDGELQSENNTSTAAAGGDATCWWGFKKPCNSPSSSSSSSSHSSSITRCCGCDGGEGQSLERLLLGRSVYRHSTPYKYQPAAATLQQHMLRLLLQLFTFQAFFKLYSQQ